MNYRMIIRTLGLIVLCVATLMILPLIVCLCYGESVSHFIITIAIGAVLGTGALCIKPKSSRLTAREGFLIVALGWIVLSMLGALPFFLSGEIPNYIDALFETVSGFTTTGASILSAPQDMSQGCLFWRSFTHWIGGMGVLLFIMAVLPMSGEHQMHIMRAELPGVSVDKLVPRVRQTAKILYIIYVCMTLVQTVLLLFGGMNLFDALTHAFATAGTGGFSTRNASIAGFDSLYIEIVCGVFMLLFAVNFNIYFFVLVGNFKAILKNEELRWYLAIVAAAIISISAGIADMYGGFFRGMRHAFFYVASIISTTGFGTVDYTTWPAYTQFIIVMLMFCGACAGSTGGGIKVSRIVILLKSLRKEIHEMAAPRHVRSIRLDGKRLEGSTLRAVHSFFISYMFILIGVSFIVSMDGYSFATSFSATLSCLSNIGPGLELVGPCGNFAIFSYPTKLLLTAAMLIGRLEIFPMLVLLSPSAWKH